MASGFLIWILASTWLRRLEKMGQISCHWNEMFGQTFRKWWDNLHLFRSLRFKQSQDLLRKVVFQLLSHMFLPLVFRIGVSRFQSVFLTLLYFIQFYSSVISSALESLCWGSHTSLLKSLAFSMWVIFRPTGCALSVHTSTRRTAFAARILASFASLCFYMFLLTFIIYIYIDSNMFEFMIWFPICGQVRLRALAPALPDGAPSGELQHRVPSTQRPKSVSRTW